MSPGQRGRWVNPEDVYVISSCEVREPVWLLDCDNTLYPSSNGLFDMVNGLISEYMRSEVGIPSDRVEELRLRYWEEYGVTMGGLVAEHGVDPDHYLAYVHDVPIDQFIAPDPAVGEAISSLPGKKVIFTNATTEHAQNILDHIGIVGIIEEIYDIRFFDLIPKPKRHPFEKVLGSLQVKPTECWFVEDHLPNLEMGHEMGMNTVLVGKERHPADISIADIKELPAAFEKWLQESC